ncbi:MAG: PEP-CTERM/exosortase system-associated acyltransferase [Candidatus Saccharibacteria bacterium]|nr:PEP-CTERM/exosortase system-associated acyltransferase [Rhodoferax sp.]
MKTHRLETSNHRFEKSDLPAHHADQAARGTRRPGRVTGGRDAVDPALKRALELRYQVYCMECSFLCPDDYPDGTETDEHDDAAQHFYAYDLVGELVGYVRLIRPNDEQRFPFQNHCVTFTDGAKLPAPGCAAEVSRLMLRSDYRRLPARGLAVEASGRPHTRRSGGKRDEAAQVLMSLYRQVYLYSRANGIDYWYAAMERPLARSLLRMNISFKEIGPLTDYYGPVVPYLTDLQALESQVAVSQPGLLAWLQNPQPGADYNYAGLGQKAGFASLRTLE